jgi:3-oxoacyl-(acyl-carrier-protein) synthase
MNQPLYIHSARAISPQNSFGPELFLTPPITSGNSRLYALDAPYAQYISPVAIRRMSRIMKMTISAAMQCLRDAGVKTPDAIITGTGRGGVTDMEMFVKDMIALDEGAMNPTSFIQSTYNSPNGWIAMQSGCTGYNQTYVHRGCSFELALLDAQMILAESDGHKNILVGGYDEMTEEYFYIRGKRGYWKKSLPNSIDLFRQENTDGTLGGEGAAFFLVSNQALGASARIDALRIIHHANSKTLKESTLQILREAGLAADELSLLITGLNGDLVQSSLYTELLETMPDALPVAVFKHLSGEYDTAAGFGLWLANFLLAESQSVNEMLLYKGVFRSQFLSKILIVNHFITETASIMLVSLENSHSR